MATKKKTAADSAAAGADSSSYEASLQEYAGALEMMRNGRLEEAKPRFAAIIDACIDEPELADRAASYMRICERRLDPGAGEPGTAEEKYHRGVVLLNDGRFDEAMQMLDGAIEANPTSATYLYARASVWALQGKTTAAVTDLSQAIATDPTLRFQAANDPDFEQIREEPAFIDIIEPTPTGA